MKIKITRDTMAEGKSVKAGDVVDIAEQHAKTLILLGKATEVKATAPTVTIREPGKEGGKREIILPPPAAKGENLEDALEKDTDLGGRAEEAPDLATLSYEILVDMAKDHGIEKPEKMKKAVLIDAIKSAQAKQAA